MNFTKRITSVGLIGLVALVSLALLSQSSQAATPKPLPKASTKAAPKAITKPTGNAMPNGGAEGRGFGGGGLFANLTDVQKSCLATNGFVIPVRPSGAPTARPTDFPTARPTDAPGANGANGQGGQGGGQGRGFGRNFDPAVMQAAFSKCGIAVPSFGGRNGGAPGANGAPAQPGATTSKVAPPKAVAVSPKQAAFVKCMTMAGIKNLGAALAYDQSDPDTALALVKCKKSTGFVIPKKA